MLNIQKENSTGILNSSLRTLDTFKHGNKKRKTKIVHRDFSIEANLEKNSWVSFHSVLNYCKK